MHLLKFGTDCVRTIAGKNVDRNAAQELREGPRDAKLQELASNRTIL